MEDIMKKLVVCAIALAMAACSVKGSSSPASSPLDQLQNQENSPDTQDLKLSTTGQVADNSVSALNPAGFIQKNFTLKPDHDGSLKLSFSSEAYEGCDVTNAHTGFLLQAVDQDGKILNSTGIVYNENVGLSQGVSYNLQVVVSGLGKCQTYATAFDAFFQ
jgi:hypothetical protein